MPTFAGQMDNAAHPNPQWYPCDGKYHYGYVALPNPARPHIGLSTGTRRDYWRINRCWLRTRGIGGWMIGVPYDPGATWMVSLADDNGETPVANATVQKPPAGVR
jgi:hypothetical protein